MAEIKQLIATLKNLNKTFNTTLITPEEFTQLEEEWKDLEIDLQHLEKTMKHAVDLREQNIESGTQAMAHLYKYLGNIIQDLENIHEITTIGVQRFSKHFLENIENK